MAKEDFLLCSMLVLILVSFTSLGFHLGRVHERHYWERALPKELMDLCIQCRELGEQQQRRFSF